MSSEIDNNIAMGKEQFPPYLLKVETQNQYSLFHAIELMRIYIDYLQKGTMSEKTFRWIKTHQADRLTPFANELMKQAEIPYGKNAYNMQHSIEQIQQMWDWKFPGIIISFKILRLLKISILYTFENI